MTVRALVLCLSMVAVACARPVVPGTDGGADGGARDAGVDGGGGPGTDGGVDGGPGGGDVDGGVDAGVELIITRLLPPRGPAAGGSPVVVEGSGFLRNFAGSGSQARPLTSVRLGANTVQDYLIVDDRTLELRTPPGVVGPATLTITNPNGTASCTGCFTFFAELVVTGVTPREGPLGGGTELTITGQGFGPRTQVNVGAYSSPRITVQADTELKAVVPRGAAAGLVDVVVYDQNGVSTQRRVFRYVAGPRLRSAEPPTGPVAGGTVVTLAGEGLAGASEVRFGATPAALLDGGTDSGVTVVAPAASGPGAVDVTVVTPGGSWTLRGGFTHVNPSGPFAAHAVVPHVIAPGERVRLTGQRLDEGGLTVSLGGQPATVTVTSPFTAEVEVPARGSSPRVADVVVRTTASGPVTLGSGVTWRAAVSGLSPPAGPVDGGTVLTISGSALPPQLEVTVGTYAATGVTVSGEALATAVTPPGSGGVPVDVVLRESGDPQNEVVVRGGFSYLQPLTLGRLQPGRGAVAGGTLVTVLGSGFTDATTVSFGTLRAKDVKLVDSHTLTCRAPKASVGTVDVTVEKLGERDTLPGGYSYFDPRSIAGGLSGGPLVGTLNVTVLDSTPQLYGAPVPLATVVLGLDPTTPYQGLTDQRGQITFSDPALVKAQTVTVFKEGYDSATIAQVTAENVTVFLSRTGGGDASPAQPPPGPPPSTISGRVTGFKSPRPLRSGETLEARVFVAQSSPYGGPPFGGVSKRGEKWRLTTDGEDYLVFSGAGLRAVYAVLGFVEADRFTPIAMGIRRGVTTSPEVPAVDETIVLDTPLDLTVPVTIDGPLSLPGDGGSVPLLNTVYAWLDLGAEGYIPNPYNWNGGQSGVSSVASTMSQLSFPGFPQLSGASFIFLNEASGPQFFPASFYFRRQQGNLASGVTIGPLLPPPVVVRPEPEITFFDGIISWALPPGVTPDFHNVQVYRADGLRLWELILPGTETEVQLPRAGVEKLRADAQGQPLFMQLISSRAPRFSYSQITYDLLSLQSWSSFTIAQSDLFTP